MIRSSAQPSTKACASSALANETCAICACLRCRTFTCGAATTTTLMRRRGDSRPRQRGGQAYLHTAVAPDDSLDAPFGRTRREGDLDPAGPHGSCQKARDLVRCHAPRHAPRQTHTADAPLMSIRLTFEHENFLGDLKKNSVHTSRLLSPQRCWSSRAMQAARSLATRSARRLMSTYSEKMDATGRPISPHITIYAWPTIAISSVMMRATGMMLSIGARAVLHSASCSPGACLCCTSRLFRSVAMPAQHSALSAQTPWPPLG